MELLVVGIDGGTKDIIEGMPMPFTQSLFEKSGSKTLNEDLISRGWAEVLTGCHASENKGFYLMPFADHSYDFSGSYSKKDMTSSSHNPPLWTMLNKKDVSVGIMNVPTTGPVDSVNGFMVAGGGGGLNPGADLPPGMFFPESSKSILLKNEYVFDVRLPGGASTVSSFIKKIGDAELKQKNTFIELVDLENPDFGFHCFRITTEVQYLARYEIDRCIKGIQKAKARGEEFKPENSVQQSIIEHYRKLDENIESIFDQVNPKQFLFVGDHSTSLFKFEGNVDVWLQDKGFLERSAKWQRVVERLRGIVKSKLSKILKPVGLLQAKKKGLVRRPITRFIGNRTVAFGSFYDTGNFAGIYINDEKRFGGPVKGSQEIGVLVEKICMEFNSDPVIQSYGMFARAYRSSFEDSDFYEIMPDIKIEKPDTIYFSGRKWQFISENFNLKPFSESLEGVKYPFTGVKGADPLFVYSEGLAEFVDENDPNDLRMAYNMIERYFSRNEVVK